MFQASCIVSLFTCSELNSDKCNSPRRVNYFGAVVCSQIATLFGASGVRILPHFAGFFRRKPPIPLVFRVTDITLDQHIGVRIPGGQPKILNKYAGFTTIGRRSVIVVCAESTPRLRRYCWA
jgi:hypothetical protein